MTENAPDGSLLQPGISRTLNDISAASSDRSGVSRTHLIQRVGRSDRGVQRQARVSEAFYGDPEDLPNDDIGFVPGFLQMDHSQEVKKYHLRQSRRLPVWIWYLLAKSLGIKTNSSDRPIFGTFLHALTLTFAAGYVITFAWFTAYDIMSEYTRQTVLSGCVAIVIAIYWSSLGVYANKLAAKLFSSQKFVESVRLHSRTIFKISAAGIMILIGLTDTVLNNYSAFETYGAERCVNVTVSPVVCYVMLSCRIGCSSFCLLWNMLVGIVLLSVCRTHTIGIRRFIKQLEDDGKMYEIYRRNLFMQAPGQGGGAQRLGDPDNDNLEEDQYEWDEEVSPLSDDYCAFPVTQSPSIRGSPPVTPTRRLHLQRCPREDATTRQLSGLSMATNSPLRTGHSDRSQIKDQTADSGVADNAGFPSEELIILDVQDGTPSTHFVFSTNHDAAQTVTSHPVAMATSGDSTNQYKRPCPGSKPIIIIKEGSIATSEEADRPSLKSADRGDGQAAHQQQLMQVPEHGAKRGDEDGARAEFSNGTRLIHPDPPSFASRSTQHSAQHSTRVELNSPRLVLSSVTGPTDGSTSSYDDLSVGPHMLSPDDILLCYWRINSRLRSTSIALQRWLVAWVTFIIVWSLTFLLHWISHQASLREIAEFILPILLLPLVCTAYGEVNNEGKRMIKSICPTSERTQMLIFLDMQPLELTAFGFPINYSSIVTVIGALTLAFCSKIVLEEINIM